MQVLMRERARGEGEYVCVIAYASEPCTKSCISIQQQQQQSFIRLQVNNR